MYVCIYIYIYIYIYISSGGRRQATSPSAVAAPLWNRALAPLLIMNSFQTTLSPNPKKYINVALQQNKKNIVFERALQMLSSSGAGGLVTVHISASEIYAQSDKTRSSLEALRRTILRVSLNRDFGILSHPSVFF